MLRLLPRWVIGLLLLFSLSVLEVQAQEATPEAVQPVETGDGDIVNFLLLGSDTVSSFNAGRTDVIMIVSVNRTAGTVAFLSIPRDLYVYIPGWQMNKINTAYGHGEGLDSAGAELLKATILFNLGIEIDYYARVDFNGFKALVDNVGGVEISVDCAIEDWRLIDPTLDPLLEESWAIFTLPVGVHQMDGDTALWYVRSRRTSSDIDRGRRQQAMLKALWQRILELDLLNQMDDVWTQLTETVRTDIALDEMIGLVPLALTIQSDHIASYTMRINQEIVLGTSPEGSSILVIQPEPMRNLISRFLTPPTQSQIAREQPQIEIVNASGVPELARVAADRLALEGFIPVISADSAPYQDMTQLYDFTGQTKGSSLAALQSVLRLRGDGVIVEPSANRRVDFRVVIGGAYHACTHGVIEPAPPSSAEGAQS